MENNIVENITLNMSGFNEKMESASTQINLMTSNLNLLSIQAKIFQSELQNLNTQEQGQISKLSSASEAVHALANSIGGVNAASGAFKAKISGNVGALATFNSKLIATKNNVDKLSQGLGGGQQGTSSIVGRISGAIGKIGAECGKVARELGPLAGELKKIGKASVTSIMTFDSSMGKLGNIANTTQVPINKLRKQILNLSQTSGIAPTKIAAYTYSVINAGVKTNKALDVVSTATKLAGDEFSTTSNTITVLLSLMKQYGIKTADVGDVSNDLVITQKATRLSFADLTKSIDDVTPSATKVGLNLKNVCASLITLGSNGKVSSKSVSGLKSLFNDLSKSGSESNKILQDMGDKSFSSLVKQGTPVNKILQMIYKGAKKNKISLSKMFGSVSAGNVALALMGKHGTTYNKALKSMGKNCNATNKAYKEISNTVGNKLKKAMNSLKIAGIKLGGALLPIVKTATKGISKLAKIFEKLSPGQLKAIVGIGLAVVAFVKICTAIKDVSLAAQGFLDGFKLISKMLGFMLSPIGLVVLAIAAIGVILVESYKHCYWFRNKVNYCWDEIKRIFEGFTIFLKDVFLGKFTGIIGILVTPLQVFMQNVVTIWDGIKGIFLGVIEFVEGVFTGNWSEAWNGIVKLFSSIFGMIGGIINNDVQGIKNIVGDVVGWAMNKIDYVKNIVAGVGHSISHAFGDVFVAIPHKAIGKANKATSFAKMPKSESFATFGAMNLNSLNNVRSGIGSLGVVENSLNQSIDFELIATKVADKISNAISNSNDKYIQTNVILDGKQIATATAKPINNINGRTLSLNNRQRGIL